MGHVTVTLITGSQHKDRGGSDDPERTDCFSLNSFQLFVLIFFAVTVSSGVRMCFTPVGLI